MSNLNDMTMKRLFFLFAMALVCTVSMSAQEPEDCSRCGGEGRIPDKCSFCKEGWRECNLCTGKRYIHCTICMGAGKYSCYSCNGRGYWVDKHGDRHDCSRCDGVGTPVCTRCSGDGEIMCPSCEGAGGEKCRQCDGTGEKWWTCPECMGKGHK